MKKQIRKSFSTLLYLANNYKQIRRSFSTIMYLANNYKQIRKSFSTLMYQANNYKQIRKSFSTLMYLANNYKRTQHKCRKREKIKVSILWIFTFVKKRPLPLEQDYTANQMGK